MAFTEQASSIPTSIGAIVITLLDKPVSDEPALKTARYKVHVLDQDGQEMRVIEGDLVPHLVQADVTWLLDFVTRMRTKAVDELLP